MAPPVCQGKPAVKSASEIFLFSAASLVLHMPCDFMIVWRFISAVAVDPFRIIPAFDVLPDQSICLPIIFDLEPIKPFPLDQRMKRFDTRVVIRGSFFRIAALHSLGHFPVETACIMDSSICMDHDRIIQIAYGSCFFQALQHFFYFKCFRQSPCDDFPGIQIHDRGKIYESG